jgi:hypothetical protein
MMMNIFKVGMIRYKIIGSQLQIKNNKYAAIDPAKQIGLMKFALGQSVDLGNNYWFKFDGSFESLLKKDNRNEGYSRNSFGRVEYVATDDDDEGYGQTVCRIEMSNHNRDDLTYQMVKNLRGGATRVDVIKATAKVMQYYHDNIEQYVFAPRRNIFVPGSTTTERDSEERY